MNTIRKKRIEPATAGDEIPFYKPGMFVSLQFADFRRLWLSNLAASFAMQMQAVARGWLIYDMTSSALALTWVMLSFMMPFFVFSLAGGVIADRLQKKSIMLYSQILNMIATIFLAQIIYSGNVTFWHFIFFGIFNGTVLAFSWPARSSMVPEVVGTDTLVNAMALQSATLNLSRILGPALAGGMIAFTARVAPESSHGVGLVFYIIAGLYALAVISVYTLNYRGKPAQRDASSPFEDIKEGFRYMRDEKLIVGILLLGFIPLMFGFAPSFLLPAFNQDVIEGGPDDLGMLMAGMGVGALVGSLLLARLGDVGNKGRLLFGTAYCWAISIIAFSLTDQIWVAMVVGAVTGLFGAIFGAMNMSILQMSIKPEIRGRVMSIMMMTHGLMPLGIIPVSAAAEFIGIDVAIMISALLLALSTFLLGIIYPELRRIDRGHSS